MLNERMMNRQYNIAASMEPAFPNDTDLRNRMIQQHMKAAFDRMNVKVDEDTLSRYISARTGEVMRNVCAATRIINEAGARI